MRQSILIALVLLTGSIATAGEYGWLVKIERKQSFFSRLFSRDGGGRIRAELVPAIRASDGRIQLLAGGDPCKPCHAECYDGWIPIRSLSSIATEIYPRIESTQTLTIPSEVGVEARTEARAFPLPAECCDEMQGGLQLAPPPAPAPTGQEEEILRDIEALRRIRSMLGESLD